MSGLGNLRTLAKGWLPANDGLLGNARSAWGREELLSQEGIVGSFVAHPFELDDDAIAVETPIGAALVGEDSALFADLYDGRIGRLWRVGGTAPHEDEPAIDVPFDADMHQDRGDVCLRTEDHPGLSPAAADAVVEACKALVERKRTEGSLRARGFVLRAFGDGENWAALMSVFTLGGQVVRTASFDFAAVAGGVDGKVRSVGDTPKSRAWTPRL